MEDLEWPGRDSGAGAVDCAGTVPPNDDFANALWRDWSRATWFGDNSLATTEVGEPLAPGGQGSTVWYGWRAPASGPVRFDTVGSGLDTVLAVYTGTAVGSLSLVAWDDDSAGIGASRLSFAAVEGELYRVAVDSKAGSTGWFALSFVQQLTPPPANDDFAEAAVLSGLEGEVTGSNVSATREAGEPTHFPNNWGGASVWYRWAAPADGTLVLRMDETFALKALVAVYSGTSLPTLTRLASEGPSKPWKLRLRVQAGGSYAIAVDGFGIAAPMTGSFTLSWRLFEPPANDDFADAVALLGASGTVSSSNEGATGEPGEPDHQGKQGGASVWYRWTAPATERVRLDVYDDGFGFGSLIAVYTGESVDALTAVPNEFSSIWSHSKLTFDAVAGTEYRIAVDGGNADIGAFTLRWKPAGPANDDFLDAEVITALETERTTSSAWATKESGEPTHAGQAGGASVWYRFTPPTPGRLTLHTDGSTVATLLAVYTGDDLAELTEVASDDSLDGSATLAVQVDGTRLWIAADTVGGAAGTVALQLRFRPFHDDFADAQVFTGAFGSAWAGIVGATGQAGEPAHGGLPAERSVWWRWTAPATGTAVFRAWAGPDSRLAAYGGVTLATLTPLGSDRVADGGGDPRYDPGWLEVRFRALEGATYHLAVDGGAYLANQVAVAAEMLPNAPAPSIPAGTQISTGAVPVRIGWSGPTGDGIERFDVQQLAEGDWVDVASPSAARLTRALAAAPGYRFRVRAAAGSDASAWVVGPSFALAAYQEASVKIRYRGAWVRRSSASAFAGALKQTSARGATARFSTVARSLALVAPKGPRHGKATILVDGKRVKTLDLYAPRARAQGIVFARNWPSAGAHTITVRALGSGNRRSLGRRVALDAIVTVR